MLYKSPWEKVDPELKFEKQLLQSIGPFKMSKLTGIMESYNAFDEDFFKPNASYSWSQEPYDTQIMAFVPFINNIAFLLIKRNELSDAEVILRISIKIKNSENAAHITLAQILDLSGRYTEALKEALIALKETDSLEIKSHNLPSEYKAEIGLDYDFNGQRQFLNELIEKIKNTKNK